MITPSKKGGGDERMHLRRRPFRRPYGGVDVIHAASPNAACPGLLLKPLDAAIGRLLTPYRPRGRQGDSKQYKDVICTHFDGRFNGHRNAAVLYRAHRPMEEVQGSHISH
jgi:hypothetical protein